MKLEFRIPISPDPGFYSQVRLAAMSLRHLGAPYDQARILVSVGDYAELKGVQAANRWSLRYPVEWRMVPHASFRRLSYFATGSDCYAESSDADVIAICNADLCFVRRIDDLAMRISQAEGRIVAGLQAHLSPFGSHALKNEAEWYRLFAAAGLGKPELNQRYSNDSAQVLGNAPPYFNLGVAIFNREAFAVTAPLWEPYIELAGAHISNIFFKAQIGFSLIMAAANLKVEQLPHAYNCANDDAPFSAPEEVRLHDVEDINAIHYLRTDQLNRQSFLVDRAHYNSFMSDPNLNRVNSRLRNHILKLSEDNDLVWGF